MPEYCQLKMRVGITSRKTDAGDYDPKIIPLLQVSVYSYRRSGDCALLTQYPARDTFLDTRRKTTKMVGRMIRAIIEDTSRPCWLALRSIPGGGACSITQGCGWPQWVLSKFATSMSQC